MKTFKIKIYDIEWNLKNSFYDDIPDTFEVEEDVDNLSSGKKKYDKFAHDWIMYNGSKWGAKPKSWKVEVLS